MTLSGWRQLVDGVPWFRAAGSFPFVAYSEFMPPPREFYKPYLDYAVNALKDDDRKGAVFSFC